MMQFANREWLYWNLNMNKFTIIFQVFISAVKLYIKWPFIDIASKK